MIDRFSSSTAEVSAPGPTTHGCTVMTLLLKDCLDFFLLFCYMLLSYLRLYCLTEFIIGSFRNI